MNQQSLEELYREIPKYPQNWNSEDIATWLRLIGLEMYQESFQEMRIDGLMIFELQEEDIEQELKIRVKLHRRKIVKSLELLREYQLFLQQKTLGQPAPLAPQTTPQQLKSGTPQLQNDQQKGTINAVQSATENAHQQGFP